MSTRVRPHELGEEAPPVAATAADVDTAPSRITVGIIPTAWTALQWLMERTRLNRTDVVNRAISVYAIVEQNQANGYELVFRDPRTGKERIVTIL